MNVPVQPADDDDIAPRAASGGVGEGAVAPSPRLSELTLGIVLIVIAAIGLIDVRTDELLPLGASGADPGPAFLPEVLFWLLGVGGFIQMVLVAQRARRLGGFREGGEFTVGRLWVPALLLFSVIVYQQALQLWGYIATSIVFALIWVPIIQWRSGGRFRRRYMAQLPFEALALALVLYLVFRYGIRVPLP